MNYKLYNEPSVLLTTETQYLLNRGIDNVSQYLNFSYEDRYDYNLLGEEELNKAAKILVRAVAESADIFLPIDCDCDGYLSAALFINYLYDLFPSYVKNGHIKWVHHQGKQHGLQDCINEAVKYKYIVAIDSSSNDIKEQQKIIAEGGSIIILDHHLIDSPPTPHDRIALVNNQNYSQYPNKEMCGAAVVWQFCEYLDKFLGVTYSQNYIDMVATALMGDMMNLKSAETKAIMFEGFRDYNIHNPLLYGMIQKNNFSLNKSDYKPSEKNHLLVSPMGVAFFVVPYLNAITRSGTLEEKTLIFKSLLKFEAYKEVLSNKRGHKQGETEQLIDQALRTMTNVKNRQQRNIDAGMELLEELIENNNMMEHKVLLFLLDEEDIDPNISGLVANKIMAKYQRCTGVLRETKVEEKHGCNSMIEVPVYSGSMRGYADSGLESFKDICEKSKATQFVAGHGNAAGLGIYQGREKEFLEDTDKLLSDLPDEPCYNVDYIWDSARIDGQRILELVDMNDYIGTGLPRTYVAVENVSLTDKDIQVMKSYTLRIKTASGIDIIMFKADDDIYEELQSGKVNFICKVARNEWMGRVSPQLICEDYEVVSDKKEWIF